MDEAERTGVERLPGAEGEAVVYEGAVGGRGVAAQYLIAAIAFVVEERVTDVPHVDAYLMGAPRLEAAFHQGDVSETFQYPIVRDGWLAHLALRREAGHPQAILWVASDVALDATFVLRETSPHERIILSSGSLDEELVAQVSLGLGRLGDDEQAARILVDAVDESHVGIIGVKVWVVAQVPCQRIDQRAAVVAASRVYHQSGWLIDDHQLVIFVGDVEWDILGHNLPVALGAFEHEGHHLEWLHLVVALHRPSVHADASCLGRLLNAVAAGVAQMIH